MLSGVEVGGLLRFICDMIKPSNVLELGVFTGYSSICIAQGLREGGLIDAIEINDELEELILEAYSRAGVDSKITLHFGDAKEIIPTLTPIYDMVYIDANKREYVDYYNLIIDRVRSGGYIIADNVLWDGKVLADIPSQDAQTQGLLAFNRLVASDHRVENIILPIRDGINLIRKR